jgi:RNA polymerase sigma-70 factor (ECF subfamily)
MYNVVMRIVNHAGEAEDILQESFLEAFHKIGDFRGEASFGAWLKKIVVNRAISSLRKRKLELFEQIPGANELIDEETNYDHEAIALEVKKLHSAMMGLPSGYRMVISLYLLEGYDHSEIAQILNITESTSKTQYNRAKEKLRIILNEKYHEG